jgi:2-polyprenyl-3-methyl-5-hydroxy-6-metoxy-1,4-benzoquinol methylase
MIKLLKKLNWKRNSEAEFYKDLFIKNPTWNKVSANAEEQLRWEIIQDFLNEIGSLADLSHPKILDIGCGRGWMSNLLSFYGETTGIEPVKAVVKYAKKLFPNINFRYGKAEDLITEGKTLFYDIVVCSEVIEHIPHTEKKGFLLKIRELLKPNGFLILTTPRKDAEIEWRKYTAPGQPIEDWITEGEMQQLFNDGNMKMHSLKRFSIPPAANAPLIEIYQLWLVQKL